MLGAGMYERLLTTVPEALEAAGRSGLGRWARPQLRDPLAYCYLIIGDLARSREQIDLARMDAPTGRVRAVLELLGALAATAAGAYREAAEHLEASRLSNMTPEAESGRGWLATARARLALAEGRLDDVRDIVNASAPRVLASGVYNGMSDTVWWMAEVGLASLADEAERARAANDLAKREAVMQAMAGMHGWLDEVRRQRDAAGGAERPAHAGSEAMIKGHVARIEGRDEPGLWAAAATQFPERSVEAQTARYRQAEAMLAARVPREQVREVMLVGHAGAVWSGARPLVEQFEALARRARIDLHPSPAGADSAPSGDGQPEPLEGQPSPGHLALRKRGLSDREIEVLTLVAAGFSNPQIAERLFISVKTASVHVSHILDKLGVTSRTEAATVGVRLGLPKVS
jgi:DNA-binding NarL/FixJ family response regulator